MELDTISDALGTLSGDLYPISCRWENGLLLASGGKLQYFNGSELLTLDSPNATSVYIRAGRVLITDENNLIYSAVGDESNWVENTDDDSSSKFVEIGYKDDGKLLGMVNTLIKAEVQSLPANTLLRFMPTLNQIWAISCAAVLMFDIVRQSWFKRLFNSPVLDVIPIGNEVLIIKGDRCIGNGKHSDWSAKMNIFRSGRRYHSRQWTAA